MAIVEGREAGPPPLLTRHATDAAAGHRLRADWRWRHHSLLAGATWTGEPASASKGLLGDDEVLDSPARVSCSLADPGPTLATWRPTGLTDVIAVVTALIDVVADAHARGVSGLGLSPATAAWDGHRLVLLDLGDLTDAADLRTSARHQADVASIGGLINHVRLAVELDDRVADAALSRLAARAGDDDPPVEAGLLAASVRAMFADLARRDDRHAPSSTAEPARSVSPERASFSSRARQVLTPLVSRRPALVVGAAAVVALLAVSVVGGRVRSAPRSAAAEPLSSAAPTVDGDPSPKPTEAVRSTEPGDLVAAVDWACDGIARPVVYRPSTGAVFVFDDWPEPGAPATELSTTRAAPGGASIEASPNDVGCGALIVRVDGTPLLIDLDPEGPAS